MHFIHHAAVTKHTIALMRQFLAEYAAAHPGVITRHGVGFLGKNYLIYATENIAELARIFHKKGQTSSKSLIE